MAGSFATSIHISIFTLNYVLFLAFQEQGQDPFLLRSIFVACKEAGRISDLFKELDLELITADSERLEVTFPIGVLLRVLAEQPQYLAEGKLKSKSIFWSHQTFMFNQT